MITEWVIIGFVAVVIIGWSVWSFLTGGKGYDMWNAAVAKYEELKNKRKE